MDVKFNEPLIGNKEPLFLRFYRLLATYAQIISGNFIGTIVVKYDKTNLFWVNQQPHF